jgi:murein DD-endopeptidase MepM/ murein hydrolase activator NlpD
MKRRFLEITILIAITVLIIVLIRFLIRREEPEATPAPVPPQLEYGIVVDSMISIRGVVQKNQYLSDILMQYGVEYARVDRLVGLSVPVFDVRKLRTGNKYTVLCTNDTNHFPLHFIYEDTPVSFVVFDLKEPLRVYRGNKELQRIVRETSGVINSSLWNAMVAKGDDPTLAVNMSDVYAWTIDFFGIQKGDHYHVIYEDLVVEGKSIGIGDILAARFHHASHDYFAFYFVQDSVGDYFDEQANSLRREFLKAPLKFSRISSRFSNNRYHPVLKIHRPHHGVDYAAPAGTPVQTIGDGVVIKVAYEKGGGKYIKIKHNSVYSTTYMHLQGYAKGIREGMHVKQGDVIGYVGSTGLATGPHLDFRVYKNGSAVDPLKMESPPAEPVKAVYRPEFDSVKNVYLNQLNK